VVGCRLFMHHPLGLLLKPRYDVCKLLGILKRFLSTLAGLRKKSSRPTEHVYDLLRPRDWVDVGSAATACFHQVCLLDGCQLRTGHRIGTEEVGWQQSRPNPATAAGGHGHNIL
jgi:hypothetical protein